MNQKDRMLHGLPYKAWLDGLQEERELCKEKVYELNMLAPKERNRIPEILKKLFGRTGENVWVKSLLETMLRLLQMSLFILPDTRTDSRCKALHTRRNGEENAGRRHLSSLEWSNFRFGRTDVSRSRQDKRYQTCRSQSGQSSNQRISFGASVSVKGWRSA